jgi:hypothetical protein
LLAIVIAGASWSLADAWAQSAFSIEKLSGGGMKLHVAGPGGWTYSIQARDDLLSANWTQLGTATTNATGDYILQDLAAVTGDRLQSSINEQVSTTK